MKQRWNGSIQSTNTPVYNQKGVAREEYGQYRCMITKIYYVDNPKNITKNSQNPEVVYEAVILGGPESGQILDNCRLSGTLGGTNYYERTLKATTKDLNKVKLSDHDGDIVLIQFIQGHDGYPVIISVLNGFKTKYGTSSVNGPRQVQEYNGLNQEINNKGEYIVKRKGGKLSQGVFTANDAEDVTVTISENNVKFTTKGGAVATIDGKNNNISIKAGSTEILIDGKSGKISLKGNAIDLGSSVSDFVTKFTELASAFNSHTHQFTDVTPSGPVPSVTQPPSAPLTSSVGSQTVKVQS